jgi:hypothetical protein
VCVCVCVCVCVEGRVSQIPFQPLRLDVGVHACHLNNVGSIKRTYLPGKNTRPYLKTS